MAEGSALLLYLIRHAEAEETGSVRAARDFDRPLSPKGREQVRSLAQAFHRRGLAIDALAASPLVRAYQTAVEFLAVLAPGIRPVTCDDLAIDRLKPSHLSDFLAHLPPRGERTPLRDEKAVAVVGHMPDLGIYSEWLLGSAPSSIRFAKAGAACILFKERPAKASGELLWLITPEWYPPTE